MSQNPLIKKLRIKNGDQIAIVNAPAGYRETLGNLPPETTVVEALDDKFDIVHGFFTQKADLEGQVADLKAAMKDGGILWISYPKGSAKKETDLKRGVIYELLLQKGLQAVAQISIDEVWSAMRFKKVA